MKPLPDAQIDYSEYKPFIKNDWFRKNFMWFVYALQIGIVVGSIYLGIWNFSNIFIKILIFIAVYLIHEMLHISVVFRIGDISLTHSGIFFWLNSGAKMSKIRFWLFMTLPLIVLTGIPAILGYAVNIPGTDYFRYIAWINAIIAGADIINSVLILVKPNKAVFYRGFYKV